jgi:2-(1,2-epoxy-1,2-dihydrophenyl)acetyl-CoA isomerase
MNAMDRTMHAELRHAFDRIEGGDGIRAMILAGAGRRFCAGAYLHERAAAFERGETPDLHAALDENYNPLIRRIAALPVPAIAAGCPLRTSDHAPRDDRLLPHPPNRGS